MAFKAPTWRELVFSAGQGGGWTPAPTPYVPPSNNPYASVANSQSRLVAAGLPVPEPDKPGFGSILFHALDILDRPRNALFTGIKYATSPAARYGVPGAPGFGTGFMRGLRGEQKTYGSDFIPETAPKIVRTVAGLGLDALGDPMTYATAGVGKLGQAALIGGSRAAEANLARQLSEKLGVSVAGHNPSAVRALLQTKVDDTAKAVQAAEQAAKQPFRSFAKTSAQYFPGLNPQEVTPERIGKLRTFLANDLDTAASLPEHVRLQFERLGKLDVYDNVVAHMDPEQQAIAGKLVSLFGTADFNVARAAEMVSKNKTKGIRGGKKGLPVLEQRAKSAFDAMEEARKAGAELKLTEELSAQFEKSTSRYYLKYMGVPIVDISPVGRAARDKVFMKLYNASPTVKYITDTLGELFAPHYLKLDAALSEYGPGLRQAERAITRTLEMENAIPRRIAEKAVGLTNIDPTDLEKLIDPDDVLKTVNNGQIPLRLADAAANLAGTDIATNPKLDSAVGYYIEYLHFKPLMEKLEEKGGMEYKAAKAAVEYWETKLAPNFTAEEVETLKRAARAWEIYNNNVVAKLDDFMGRDYDPIEDGYFPRIYRKDDKAVRSQIKSLMGPTERVRRRLSTGLEGHEKSRKILSMALAKEMGLDPVESFTAAVAVRMFRTERAWLHRQLADQLKSIPGLISTAAKEGFQELKGVLPGLTQHWAHPELVRHLRRFDYVFYNDAGFSDLMRGVARITNLVKEAQIGYNPNTLGRNVLGELTMNIFAGIGMKSHELAEQVLRGTARDELVQVGGREVPLGELLREFQDNGLWFSGVTRGNLAQSFENLIDEELRALRGGSRAPVKLIKEFQTDPLTIMGKEVVKGREIKTVNVQLIRDASDFFDKYFRLAHYIDRRMKGWGIEEAVADVRKFHVDYQDLTVSEKYVFRNLVPYYTYFRKNLPIQLRIMFEQPGYLLGVAKLVNNASHTLGDPTLSRYAEETLALPLYQKDNGDVVVLNWNLPVADLGRVYFNFGDNLREQLTSLNPLIRVPFEVTTNRAISTDRPIEKYEGEQVPIFPQWVGGPRIGAKLRYALQQFTGAAYNVPASALGRLTGYEQEISDRPTQVPVLGSLLPIQRPLTAYTAEQYRYRDKLLAAIRAAQVNGTYVPTVRDINSDNWGR